MMTLFVEQTGMIFLSDEDVDVKRLLARWIKTQPEDLRGGLSGWVDDMFYRWGNARLETSFICFCFCLCFCFVFVLLFTFDVS